MRRPLLIEPGPFLVLPACHEFEVRRVDTACQPARVVRLVPGWDRPAVVDLPGDLVAAADLLSHADEGVAVLVGGALPAPAADGVLTQLRMSFCQRATDGNVSHELLRLQSRSVWARHDRGVQGLWLGYGAVAVGSATQLLAGVIAWVFGR